MPLFVQFAICLRKQEAEYVTHIKTGIFYLYPPFPVTTEMRMMMAYGK